MWIKIRFNCEINSPQKPTKVVIGPNSVSRAKDLVAVNHVTQAVIKVGSNIKPPGFKELRLKLKLLNRRLWLCMSIAGSGYV